MSQADSFGRVSTASGQSSAAAARETLPRGACVSASGDDGFGASFSTLLDRYESLFINRSDIWFRQWIDHGGRCQYFCIQPDSRRYEPVSKPLIQRHLEGKVTCSWPAIDAHGMAKWMAWDVDDESGVMQALQAVLSTWGLITYREGVRPGREGHLWLFLSRPVHADKLLAFNRELLGHAQVSLLSVEFFPKSATRFSQLRGPLGIHRKPGAGNVRGWFMEAPQELNEQLLWLYSVRPNDAERIEKLATFRLQREAQTGARKETTKTELQKLARSFSGTFRILDHVSTDRRIGRDWVARCPVCALEGGDTHEDNLRISADGNKFCCVLGGPGQVHRAQDIRRALVLGI